MTIASRYCLNQELLAGHLSSLSRMRECLFFHLLLVQVNFLPLKPKSIRSQEFKQSQKKATLLLLMLLPLNFSKALIISLKSSLMSQELRFISLIEEEKAARLDHKIFLSLKRLLE